MLKMMCYLGKTGSCDAKSQTIKWILKQYQKFILYAKMLKIVVYNLAVWAYNESKYLHSQAEVTSRGPSCQPNTSK